MLVHEMTCCVFWDNDFFLNSCGKTKLLFLSIVNDLCLIGV